jgi:hypothetical protein
MTFKKSMLGFAFVGATTCGFIGCVNSPPEKKADNAVAGVVLGGLVGAGAGAVIERKKRRGSPLSREEIETADREGKRKLWHHYDKKPEERREKQRDDDGHRGL